MPTLYTTGAVRFNRSSIYVKRSIMAIGLAGICVGGFSLSCAAATTGPTIHTQVLSVGERAFLELWRDSGSDPQAVCNELLKWRDDGRAKVVSDIAATLDAEGKGSHRIGEAIQLPTEWDQELDEVRETPILFEEAWVGTRLDLNGKHFLLKYWPEKPVATSWPLTWPIRPDPCVGWMEQYDEWLESVESRRDPSAAEPALLAAFRSANAVFPAAPKSGEPQLQIVLVLPGTKAKAEGATPREPEMPAGTLSVYMISMGSNEALRWLVKRNSSPVDTDAKMLGYLLRQVDANKAHLRSLGVARLRSGSRTTIESARQHLYPTEMHTIPSTWNNRPVGFRLEVDPTVYGNGDAELHLAVEQHLIPPRRQVWPVALDAPEMVMWQPQFVATQSSTSLWLATDQVSLIALTRVPDVLTCDDEPTLDQAVATFVEWHPDPVEAATDQPNPPVEDPFDFTPPAKPDHPVRKIELGAFVVETRLGEEPTWRPKIGKALQEPTLQKLNDQIAQGTARLEALAMIQTTSGQRCIHAIVEEMVQITEFHPADDVLGDFLRLRPTTTNMVPAGVQLEVDPFIDPYFKPGFSLIYKLRHDLQRPAQPNLPAMIMAYYNDDRYVPLHRDEAVWQGRTWVEDGTTQLVRTRVDQGPDGEKRLHLLFISGRMVGER